jgi:oxygen-independent coproporphyrinogen-3 oxidase
MAGIYIHIPFCKQACHYCDFHFSTNQSYKAEMVSAICKEIDLQSQYLFGEAIETIYFGGGTPSILKQSELSQIIEKIYSTFSVVAQPEITLEANPDDLSEKVLRNLKLLQINRLSIGIQSFQDGFLKFMNRAHTSIEASRSVLIAQDIGFNNISVDLIYGIPYPDHQHFLSDLKQLIALQTPHISAYCLTIEPKTTFGKWTKQGKLQATDELFALEQFDMLIDTLEQSGAEQYEISNFARNKQYSKHNTNYWKGVKYIGIGPGAHSYNGNTRQYNIANNAIYMREINKNNIPYEQETLSNKDKFNEYLLTAIRTKWGLSIESLKEININYYNEIEPEITILLQSEHLISGDGQIRLNKAGKFLADEITAKLLIV